MKIAKAKTRVRVVECLYSADNNEIDTQCISCCDNERCLKVRPELRAIAEEIEKSGNHELTPKTIDFIEKKYPHLFKLLDKNEGPWPFYCDGTKKIRIAKCLPFNLSEIDNECLLCSNKEVCVTINPELTHLLEECKKPDGTYEFSQDELSILKTYYPRTLEVDRNMFCMDAEIERDLLHDKYHLDEDEILHMIVSEKLMSKIENDEYTKEEMHLLAAGIRAKEDKMYELFRDVVHAP